MSDLTDRLRAVSGGNIVLAGTLPHEAANEIDRLRVTVKMLMDDKAALREQLTLAESVRASQVAGLVEAGDKLRERVAGLEDALTHISLCSQSSMSGKEECGRIARAALKRGD